MLMEESAKEVKEMEDRYLHRGGIEFDTGLKMEFLQEFYIIALDNFFKIKDNKDDTKKMSELEAWLYFIGSDKPEHILRVVEQYPWFAELYEDIAYFRQNPEEGIRMFSDALREMDENTVKLMIDDMKEEAERRRKELEESQKELEESQKELEESQKELEESQKELEQQRKENEELRRLLGERLN